MSRVLGAVLKDPEATLDYSVDWDQDGWLDGDTIAGAPEWTVPGGLELVSESNTTTRATVWLAGGTDGTDYLVECRITTTGGRTDERSFRVRVRER